MGAKRYLRLGFALLNMLNLAPAIFGMAGLALPFPTILGLSQVASNALIINSMWTSIEVLVKEGEDMIA